jgi:hypothetical protein
MGERSYLIRKSRSWSAVWRQSMKLRAGDWVEIKSKDEILKTLDKKGRLEGMPFMPQMFQYCGMKFKVFKRAHKTCDTVNPVRGASVSDAVHLSIRCDGKAYGGCQTSCLIFWKTAWLRRVDVSHKAAHPQTDESVHLSCCTEADVWAETRTENPLATDGPTYSCQATQLPYFTSTLPWWDIRQYVEDYTSGNITIGRLLRGLTYAGYYNLSRSGIGLGRPLRWFYDKFQSVRGGIPFPRRTGSIPIDQPTPSCTLDLQPGDFVRVKSHGEILATLNTESKNRGLYFDAECVPYCGGIYQVRNRVNKFIDEKTGKLITLKNGSVILEEVWCQSRYSNCRMFCPRSIYPWWREIWLERIPSSKFREKVM